MASVNKVIVVGNLGADPETRFLPSGEAVTNIRVATTDKWKDKASGEMKEATEWHRISFFGRLAEVAGEYLKKGSQVYVEGSLRTRKWQDKDGQDRYTTEIVADQMQMLGSREGGSNTYEVMDEDQSSSSQSYSQAAPSAPRQAPVAKPAAASSNFDDFEDDIPF